MIGVDKHQRWRAKNLANGLCPRCGQPNEPGFKKCYRHRAYQIVHRAMQDGVREGMFVKTPAGFTLPERLWADFFEWSDIIDPEWLTTEEARNLKKGVAP